MENSSERVYHVFYVMKSNLGREMRIFVVDGAE